MQDENFILLEEIATWECSKLLPVRQPEADNFGGRPGTFLNLFFNFMFLIWDSRQQDWQHFWLSFEHWTWPYKMSEENNWCRVYAIPVSNKKYLCQTIFKFHKTKCLVNENLHSDCNKKTNILFQEGAFENVGCKTATTLCRPQCVAEVKKKRSVILKMSLLFSRESSKSSIKSII